MVKLFIFSLLAIVLALLVSLYIGFPADPGYLLVAFGNYTFETSLFALLVALVAIYLVVRLLIFVWHLINPGRLLRLGRGLNAQFKSKTRSNTVEGLLHLTRGSWDSSYKLLRKSLKDEESNVVNYLATAYAAHKAGDREGWIQYLNQAEKKYPAAHSTIDSLRARLLFRSNQLEQSLAVLEQMKKNSLNDQPLLQLLKEVYIKLEDWKGLTELLPLLEKNEVVGSDEIEQIRVRLFMEDLYGLARGETDVQDKLAVMQKRWRKAPSRFREQARVVRHYADLLLELEETEAAAKVLDQALSRHWSDDLVTFYGERDFNCSHQQLIQAESWLKERPKSSALLLTLARLCMRNELWGKAREYYEASIKIAPVAAAYGELGRLLRNLGEKRAGEEYLDKYDELTGTSLGNLPMPHIGAG